MILELFFISLVVCATLIFCTISATSCYDFLKKADKDDSFVPIFLLGVSIYMTLIVGVCAIYGACSLCGLSF